MLESKYPAVRPESKIFSIIFIYLLNLFLSSCTYKYITSRRSFYNNFHALFNPITTQNRENTSTHTDSRHSIDSLSGHRTGSSISTTSGLSIPHPCHSRWPSQCLPIGRSDRHQTHPQLEHPPPQQGQRPCRSRPSRHAHRYL